MDGPAANEVIYKHRVLLTVILIDDEVGAHKGFVYVVAISALEAWLHEG